MESVKLGNISIPAIVGEQGPAGKIISIQVIMLKSNEEPEIINMGTESEARLTIKIPKGDIISGVDINESGELVTTLESGEVLNAGNIKGVSNARIENGKIYITLTDGREINAGNILDDDTFNSKIEEYNSNATKKTEDFNDNYDKKVESINNLVSSAEASAQSASSSASAAAGSAIQASETAESASQAITKAVSSAVSSLNSYEKTKENEFNTYYEGKKQELETVKTNAVSSVNTAKDTAVSDINTAKTNAISDFNNNASDYEKKHYNYRVVITEEVEALTEYELPCNYTVGNDSLVIFYNNELLIKETSEDEEANYREVGEIGAISNKVVFGWNLPIGSILNILVKGEYVEDETE